MPAASCRRAVGVLAAFLALGAAPFVSPGHAAAAVADSSVAISDPSGDTVREAAPAGEPKADIVAVSVRNQNDFISLTMKLAKGDDLSGTSDADYLRWAIGVHANTAPDWIVQLKRGANGFGQVIVFVPGNDPIACPDAIGSFDGVNGLYLASVRQVRRLPGVVPVGRPAQRGPGQRDPRHRSGDRRRARRRARQGRDAGDGRRLLGHRLRRQGLQLRRRAEAR
jgi:hypothetical protein